MKKYIDENKKYLTILTIVCTVIMLLITPFFYSYEISDPMIVYSVGFPLEYLDYYSLGSVETTFLSINVLNIPISDFRNFAFDGVQLVMNVLLIMGAIVALGMFGGVVKESFNVIKEYKKR